MVSTFIPASINIKKSVHLRLDRPRSDACPPGNQTFTGSIPGPAHSFVEIWLGSTDGSPYVPQVPGYMKPCALIK